MERPAVLIIGAAGFIGGWVTESLCAAGFPDVRAGVRSAARVSRLSGLRATIVPCDLMDRDALRTAMQGATIAINCVRDYSGGDLVVEGTRRLLSCAAETGTRRIIQFSSIAVYGNATGVVTEDTEPVPPLNKYAADKRAAEELCRMWASPQLETVVVRPSLVYGPFGEEWSARFMRGILHGRLKQLGAAGEGEANLIYAGDLGRFVAHLALAELPRHSVYNANGSDIQSFNEYFDRLSRGLGRGPLPHSGGASFYTGVRRQARRVGRLALRKQAALFGKFTGSNPVVAPALRQLELALRPDVHDGPPDQYARRVTFSMDRARQIGFEARTSLKEGIDASVAWARSHGLDGAVM